MKSKICILIIVIIQLQNMPRDVRGKIKLFLGPMFSGKSTSMCSAVERYHLAGKKCAIVKFLNDTRYDHKLDSTRDGIITHAGQEYNNIPIIRASNLEEIYNQLIKYDVIGIDEVQFFVSIETIQLLANNGKIVICAGLDGTHKAVPFGRILELIPMAEEVIKLAAVCMKCGDDASFTARIDKSQDDVIELIGGVETYVALCRECMFNFAEK